MLLFLRNFGGTFQRRIDLIMQQNIISFSLPRQKLNVTNTYVKVILIHDSISNEIIVRDINEKNLSYSACLHYSIIPNS